jgi:hypothetical protein
MIRRLIGLLILGVVAVVLWRGADWFGHSDALRATVVFDQPTALRRGDPVVQGDRQIGVVEKISPLGEQQAVAIQVEEEERKSVRSDSLIRVERNHDERQLVVDSNFAMGKPVEDRAVLHARDSRVARALERGGAALAPVAREAKERAAALLPADLSSFDSQLDRWNAALPEWKAEGAEGLRRHLNDVKAKAAEAESSLRRAGKNLEADELRSRAGQWIESAKKRIASEE